ncbi:MAG TPA: DHA2 family efflux MFS transporter permease subunit [Candidatus Acidoferrales bacterium]|nr:DHA2 family efflux MFS transporter permease subunit [Candidatus Acidoferrales bacterium]
MSAVAATFSPGEDIWRPAVNPWIIALTVTLATFMEVLDTSIANVALPHIAGSLSASTDESTWVLTSYLVSNAIVLPLSGWLSSLIGRKRFYMGCVALFTLSSFLCGFAPNLGMLIVFRILQGAGGGGLQPSEQAILADTFPPAKRGMAFAVYGMAVVLAPAIGPTIGGYITDNFSWRWIFYINVPVGILSLMLTLRLIQDPPYLKERKKSTHGIDYFGLGLVAVGLGALQIVLDKGQRDDWFESHFIVILSIISACALIAAVVWELRHKNPIIDLRLFHNRGFAVGNGMMFMLGVALYGTTVLLPQFVQTLMGYTAQEAGLALMPGGFTVMLFMPVVGFLLSRRADARKLVAYGMFVLSMSLFYMTRFDLQIDFYTATMARVYQAAALAFLFVPINTLVFADLPPEKNNAASGLINLSRNIGGSVGISFVETMLARRSQVHQTYLSQNLSSANVALQKILHGATQALQARGSSPGLAAQQAHGLVSAMVSRESLMLAYVDTFRILAVLILCLVPIVFLVKKPKGGAAIPVH